MNQIYFVNIDSKKRTAQCLVYFSKYASMPSFITELCEKLGCANKRRSATNFTQMVTEKGVPSNSYIMFTAAVKMSPQLLAYYTQGGGCIGFIGKLKEEIESVCFENVNVWPLDNAKKDASTSISFEAAQQFFQLSPKAMHNTAPLVSVAP